MLRQISRISYTKNIFKRPSVETANISLNVLLFLAGLSQLFHTAESSLAGYCEWDHYPQRRFGLRETVHVYTNSIRCGKYTKHTGVNLCSSSTADIAVIQP
jgi:hypothetical protein